MCADFGVLTNHRATFQHLLITVRQWQALASDNKFLIFYRGMVSVALLILKTWDFSKF